jgi:UrcA family protein
MTLRNPVGFAQFGDRREAIATSRERLDIAGSIGNVTKGQAQLSNRGVEAGVVFHDTIRPQMLVHFADLDLARPAGIAALYSRLEGAAKRVCAPLEGKDLGSAAAFQRCVTGAVTRAVAEVDRPDLSAYCRAKTQGRNGTPVRIVASR